MHAEGWTAIHDHMGPGPRTLTVRGTVMLPTPGYTGVELRPADQATDPLDYVLEVHGEPPSGIVPQIVTPYDVVYREETDFEYGTVSIVPDGPTRIEVIHPE